MLRDSAFAPLTTRVPLFDAASASFLYFTTPEMPVEMPIWGGSLCHRSESEPMALQRTGVCHGREEIRPLLYPNDRGDSGPCDGSAGVRIANVQTGAETESSRLLRLSLLIKGHSEVIGSGKSSRTDFHFTRWMVGECNGDLAPTEDDRLDVTYC